MMTFDEAFSCDCAALELLGADVAAVPTDSMGRPTPCEEWNVLDLLHHMNSEHTAICGGTVDRDADPRVQFSRIAGRWIAFFAGRRDTTVRVSRMATDIPSERVLAAHFADMLVHRWDLAAALGLPCPTDSELTWAGISVARVMTDATSPLVGRGGVYRAALPPDPRADPLENLVRMYGRDHRFTVTREGAGGAERTTTPLSNSRHAR